MLIAAAVLFVVAMLLLFIDKWFSSAAMDLSWPIRLLVFFSAALVLLHVYRAGH